MTDSPDIVQEISRMKRRAEKARTEAMLNSELKEINDLTSEIVGLPGDIAKLRDRGYAFAGYLSGKAEMLSSQWQAMQPGISSQVMQEMTLLKPQAGQLDPLLTKLAAISSKPAMATSILPHIEAVVDRLESATKEAQGRIAALYRDISRDAAEIRQKVSKFNWYMDMADDATFDFNATESVFIVAKGEWVKTGKGKQDPDGLFYLTDQRLIFERKEKEGGFLGFGAKKVQGIEWEAPVSAIGTVESEKKGFLGGKDMVHIEFSSGGPGNPTTIEVKGGINANWYAQQLERARNGDIDSDRALQVDPEIAERVRNAPTACENCGAPFMVPITQGMTEIACEYCATVVRI